MKLLTNIKIHISKYKAIYIVVLVALVSLFVAVGSKTTYPDISSYSLALAKICVASVLMSFITNAIRFLGIFKEDLTDILYLNSDFLSKRKDIGKLWLNISKVMMQNRFPAIHDSLFRLLSEYMKEGENYYRNYHNDIVIEWIDRERGIIKSTRSRNYELCVGDKNQEYEIETWTSGDSHDVTQIDSKLYIDDVLQEDCSLITCQDGARLKQVVRTQIEANRVYRVHHVLVKSYNINKDWDITFGSKYITDKLNVRIKTPEDILSHFQPLGTLNDFQDCHPIDGKEYRYDDILLPGQGFTFALKVI